jgi:hypothetical protein
MKKPSRYHLDAAEKDTLRAAQPGVVCGQGDRQDVADQLDPVGGAVIVDEGNHGSDRRSSSAWACVNVGNLVKYHLPVVDSRYHNRRLLCFFYVGLKQSCEAL